MEAVVLKYDVDTVTIAVHTYAPACSAGVIRLIFVPYLSAADCIIGASVGVPVTVPGPNVCRSSLARRVGDG